MEFDADSFREDGVWDKIIEHSNKNWVHERLNEDYIMHLITNFDSEKLIFNNKIFGQEEEELTKSKKV